MRDRRLRFVVLGLATALSLVGCVSRPPAAAGSWQRVALGLCEDYPEESRSLAAARVDLERTRASGAPVLRIAFGWDAMEPERGVYDWSFWDEFVPLAVETYGIRLIPYVCYTPRWAAKDQGEDSWRSPPRDPTDFEGFMRTLSARYGPWIDSWELWNEPDNPAYWTGNVAEYAELLAAGSRGVRQGDPGAAVVLGGLAWNLDFLLELLAEHDAAPSIDVVNVHSYFETWHEDPIEALPEYLHEAAAIVREHGEQEPLWMAEVGYSSRGSGAQVSQVYRARYDNEHTPDYQAAALARTLLVALATEELSLFAWYRINDLPETQEVIGDDNNLHLGLFDTAGGAKPAFATFRWLAGLFGQPFRFGAPRLPFRWETASPVEQRTFTLSDGRVLCALWLPPEEGALPEQPQPDLRRARVRLDLDRTPYHLVEVQYAPHRDTPAPSSRTLDLDLTGGEVVFILLR